MIKIEDIDVWGFKHAVRGMRNPFNSWDKSDSLQSETHFAVGEKDFQLMKKLASNTSEHRKFLRQIMVSMDITAPLYWWKEFDTYKIGTTANSCSTMHKIASRRLTIDDFSHDKLDNNRILVDIIDYINLLIDIYKTDGNKNTWYEIIQLLPSSFNQKRTVTMNYENVFNILNQRKTHKLDEWRMFCEILQDNLPYVKELRSHDI